MRTAASEALQEHIGRAAPILTWVINIWDKQVWRFHLRRHASAVAKVGKHIAQGMLSPSAISATVAEQSMISLDVHYSAAEGAESPRGHHIHAQTTLKFDDELVRP